MLFDFLVAVDFVEINGWHFGLRKTKHRPGGHSYNADLLR